MKLIRAAGVAICGLSLSPLVSFANVDYKLVIDQPDHHLADVSIQLPKSSRLEIDLKLPAWRTGRYEILNLANGIKFFEVLDSQGKPLKWTKVEKSTWRVFLDKPDNISVSYQVYANQLGKRTRHIDDSHAFIDASGFFMYAEPWRESPVTVELKVPDGWNTVTGLTKGNTPHTFTANDFDVLIDSPIETGINKHLTFEEANKQYELVIWGEGNYDAEQMKVDLHKLVKTYDAIWDGIPYERYVFMVHAGTQIRGATEHLNSTIIQRDRFSFAPRAKYLEFLSTASHEFIHTWNVKAYRPQGLVPYNYINPNYSTLLWLSEGSTSYFQDQLLVRAGLMTPKEFLDKLAKRVYRHENQPGRKAQSVSESSFDAWIGAHGDYAKNFQVNIYSEGFLVSWMLDAKLLAESSLNTSYRDVHRELYKQYRVPVGFTEQNVLSILQQVSGNNYQPWWKQNIHSPTSPDAKTLLNLAGLALVNPDEDKALADAGLSAKKDNILTHVRKDSAAWNAGLTAGDTLVAIDGLRVRDDALQQRLKDFKPGDTVRIDYFRNDTLKHTELTFGEHFDKPAKIKLVKKPSSEQKAFFKAWLGVDYPTTLK